MAKRYLGKLVLSVAVASIMLTWSFPMVSAIPEDTSLDLVSGERLSLDLRGIEPSQLFKILSQKLGKNIIPSKNVTSKITLFLDNVSYDEVLDVIMETQDLAYEKKGNNLIIVMTEDEYKSKYGEKFNERRKALTIKLRHAQPKAVYEAMDKLKSRVGKIVWDEATGTLILMDTPYRLKLMRDAAEDLDQPIETETFELQYASAADIEKIVSSLVTKGTGSVIADARTNSVIVTDLSGNMNRVKQAIYLLDQETRQVYLEFEIAQFYSRNGSPEISDWGQVVPGTPVPMEEGDISASGNISEIQVLGFEGGQVRSTIDKMTSMGEIKLIASPRIISANNENAVIHVGTKEAFTTDVLSMAGPDGGQPGKVNFTDIGIKLSVKPTINRDGFVTLRVHPEISYIEEDGHFTSSSSPRRIHSSSAETTLKVQDNNTAMVAGIKSSVYDTPSEFIIFITPHIIKGVDKNIWNGKKREKIPENSDYMDYERSGPEFNVNKLKNPTRKI